MAGIGGGEGGEAQNRPAHEASHRSLLEACRDRLRHRDERLVDRIDDRLFVAVEDGALGSCRALEEHAVECARDLVVEARSEFVAEEFTMLLPHQAERHDPPRTDLELGTDGPVGESNLAVAAEAVRVHQHRLDHRAVATDGGAVGSERRHAVAHDGDVGGGAADVGDHGIVGVGEMGRTDEAGGRTREDRLDRTLLHEVDRHERTVAAHDHHRGVDPPFSETPAGGGDEVVDHGDETSVEQGGDASLRATEAGRQHMAAGHRLSGSFADEFAGGEFVLGVTCGELGGDGEAINLVGDLVDAGGQFVEVERLDRITVAVVTSTDDDDGVVTDRFSQTTAIEGVLVEPDRDEARRTTRALDQSVGGKRGGQRHHLDRRRIDRSVGHGGIDRPTDPDREFVVRGGRLRLGDDLPSALVVHDGVGVRPPGVDTQRVAARLGHRGTVCPGRRVLRTISGAARRWWDQGARPQGQLSGDQSGSSITKPMSSPHVLRYATS